jgi:hypothetical protein
MSISTLRHQPIAHSAQLYIWISYRSLTCSQGFAHINKLNAASITPSYQSIQHFTMDLTGTQLFQYSSQPVKIIITTAAHPPDAQGLSHENYHHFSIAVAIITYFEVTG